MKKTEGLVIKTYNSFYYIKIPQETNLIPCKLRGKFKQQRFSLLPGDNVQIIIDNNSTGTIEDILPRTSALARPAVANVNQVVLVFAMCQPNYSYTLIDKMLALYAKTNLKIVICFNKSELGSEEEQLALQKIYGSIGYSLIFCSAQNKTGLNNLTACLDQNISVFAGPSGVGKSSLLNLLQYNVNLITGAVSDKIGRGKHTTRYSELLSLDSGGYIVDTPGFSSVETRMFQDDNISDLFIEIKKLAKNCRFSSCNHNNEPDCAVKYALETGNLSLTRYESYLQLYTEVKQLRK